MARPLFESNLVIRGLAFGSFGRCLAPRKCAFLRHGRRRGCLGASRFDAGSARPQKCVFLRHGRRRGCLGASRFVAGSARPQKCVFLRHGRRRGCLGASRFMAGTARFIMV
ncbi:hypothetical protein L3X38_041384 [Prunus dulcis]|uniref:Uncharacterized protein n=1 Tax=Prunus dulcis TaxID=3755 RepID=A0AAD4UUN3_PRUDU|nr:hypothetical protein L3X38_041384 [Prunus dulcis]